jgi:peroxiredoxin
MFKLNPSTWLALALFSFLPISLTAEDPKPEATETEKQSEVLAGHSYHGEAFNEGPRQKAFLMGGTGNVQFPVTTDNPDVQKLFDQGLGQLHGFWYFEAERTFRQAAMLDPDCAMTYWGMAMANVENQKRARGFIKEAQDRADAHADVYERLWIDGYADFLDESTGDRKTRRQAYIKSLENIIHLYPDSIEAKALLAVRLWQFKDDLPIPSPEVVSTLLDQIFAVEPMHSAHHFRIHLWDREKPERALRSAALCGQSAPTIAHMWHMPGHIFSRLNRYADAAWQQEASARVDHAQMARDRVMPDQIHNFAHNNEWLIRNLIHVGRVHDAVDLAKNMIELPRHPKYNTLKKSGRSATYGRDRLFQVLERYEMWDDLIALSDTMYLEPTDIPDQQIKRIRALGLANFEMGHLPELKNQITALRTLRTQQRDAKEKLLNPKDDENDSDEKVDRDDADETACEGTEKENDDPTDTVEDIDKRLATIKAARIELQGYKSLLENDREEAWEYFEELPDLDKVRLSRLYLNAGDHERAEQLAREKVDDAEGEVLPLANLVDVLHRAGKFDDAKRTFNDLRTLSAHIDLDAPPFQRLQPLAADWGFPENWRIKPVLRDDVGDRPSLDSLGPFRWHPSPAPPWTLTAADGKTISLDDYRGRPVIVIFYLGHGCLHCVEQLHTFAPKTKAFADAGIAIVAVSSDTETDLTQNLKSFNAEGFLAPEQPANQQPADFPFPLASNQSLDVFKAYRAYDDFESQPLHATFLIDAQQLVRWQDISYEPFNDPDFLLEESKRLLSKPTAEVALLPK